MFKIRFWVSLFIILFFQIAGYGQLTNSREKLSIVSWNIQDLGRTKDADEIQQMAQILRDFDVVALQEVVAKDPAGAKAVAKIADELNRMGAKWDYRISDPTNSSSPYIRERYAYLWKVSKVTLVGRPHLDKDLVKVCEREPYIAQFKIKVNGQSFQVVNFHSRPHNEHPENEIRHFRKYPTSLKNIIILGDFNLNEKHEVWDDLYKLGFQAAVHNLPTTLKRKCKNQRYFNHSIDNIYFGSSIGLVSSGRVDFVMDCSRLLKARGVSDHVPVYMEFGVDD